MAKHIGHQNDLLDHLVKHKNHTNNCFRPICNLILYIPPSSGSWYSILYPFLMRSKFIHWFIEYTIIERLILKQNLNALKYLSYVNHTTTECYSFLIFIISFKLSILNRTVMLIGVQKYRHIIIKHFFMKSIIPFWVQPSTILNWSDL